MTNADLLAIVPVRSGSRGVANKALQLYDGVPLVLRTLEKVRDSGVAQKIIVTTNDSTVAACVGLRGYDVLIRPEALAHPDVPLAPVVQHTVETINWLDDVAVFQATCPLLRADTIRAMVESWHRTNFDWMISLVPADHIYWQHGSPITPRVNRQVMTEHGRQVMREVGAVQIMGNRRARMIGRGLSGSFVIPTDEGLDIDTWDDMAAAKLHAGRRQILFKIRVGKTIGSGHLHRAMQLAEALGNHEVGITIHGEAPGWAMELLDQRGLWWEGLESSFLDKLSLVVLDTLDNDVETVTYWKSRGVKVMCFEDEGVGARHADMVINELLRAGQRGVRALYGPRYSVLRPEFCSPPPFAVSDRIRRVLISYGGTDPAGLNERIYGLLYKYNQKWDVTERMHLRVMIGAGVENISEISDDALVVGGNMAEEMNRADLCFTSQGRTQYEAAVMGVPTVTIAANEREARHERCPGHLHLGLHAGVPDKLITETVRRLDKLPALRSEMSATARKAVDGRGTERVVHQIEGLLHDLV